MAQLFFEHTGLAFEVRHDEDNHLYRHLCLELNSLQDLGCPCFKFRLKANLGFTLVGFEYPEDFWGFSL